MRFDDGSIMRLYRQTVQDFGLYPGLEMSEQQMEELKNAASKMSAKMRAVRIVSATNVSKRDLEERLVRKGEDPTQAKEAVAWMEELHLLDDKNTAEQIIHSCIAKGYGIQRAKQALYEKRIPKALWDAVLEDYPDQTDKIVAFLRSRIDADSDPKTVKKTVEALLRKGHSYARIREGLQMISMDSDEFMEE